MAGLYIGYALKHLEKEVYVFFKMMFLESVNTSRGAIEGLQSKFMKSRKSSEERSNVADKSSTEPSPRASYDALHMS